MKSQITNPKFQINSNVQSPISQAKRFRLLVFLSLVIICNLVFGAWNLTAFADTPNQLFEQANSLYKEAKYDQAINKYDEILKEGFTSGNLYYNLGNSYFKKGEFGKAALNYERAKQFIPNDSDLKSNYDYLSSLLASQAQEASTIAFLSWQERLLAPVSVNFLTILISLLYSAIFLLLILRMPKQFIFTAAILLLFSAVGLAGKINFFNKGAVVIVKEAQVKFEPFNSATVYFSLGQASSVRIIEASGDWYKIKRADGKIGWVEKQSLEAIK